jgi:uncharacterized protein with HEPN domain
MAQGNLLPWLTDIVEAIERIRNVAGDMTLEAFEADWEKQWVVERGIEIVSEASRHLPSETKARYPEIPWRNVADIGNVLRHAYRHVAPPVMWRLLQVHLPPLERACRVELAAEAIRDGENNGDS